MFLFSKIQPVQRGNVYIPYDLRAAMGLHNGTAVYLSLSTQADQGIQNQVVVSTLPLAKRAELWRMSAAFRDRRGLVHDLTTLLTQLNLDILTCRATTRHHDTEIVIEIEFDAGLYSSEFDLSPDQRRLAPDRTLQELHAHLVCHFIDEIKFEASGGPMLSLTRIPLSNQPADKVQHRHSAEIKDGRIRLPENILGGIRDQFLSEYPGISQLKGPRRHPLATVVTELDSDLMRITVFYRNTGYVHLRVSAKNHIGTLAVLTQEISGAGFNILHMYTRNLNSGERVLTDLLLHLPAHADRTRDDTQLRTFTRGLFKRNNLRELDCNLSFPNIINKDGEEAEL